MQPFFVDGIRACGRRFLGRLGLAVLVAIGMDLAPPAQLVHGTTPQTSVAPAESGSSAIMTVRFMPGSAALPAEIDPILAHVAAELLAAPDVRVAVIGYPEEAQGFIQSDRSRRLSLTRAITRRSRLIDMGVPQVRMIVRLMAARDGDGRRSNRVDIVKMSGDG
jgi:outer membrane protein OmpA-like peptidoglycan-associated protein